MDIEKHHMKLCVAAFALTMHRKMGLDSDQIADILVATNEYSKDALCFQDARKELKGETGLDIGEFVEDVI